jgi:uncharacterized protein
VPEEEGRGAFVGTVDGVPVFDVVDIPDDRIVVIALDGFLRWRQWRLAEGHEVAVDLTAYDEEEARDVDGAKSFYTEVLGWTTRDMDMGDAGTYTIFQRAGEVDVAGCMAAPEGMQAPPHWLPYVATEDVDATVAKAKELGATAFVEGDDIPNVGRIAVLQDPVGAVFGLFKPSES